MKELSGHGFYGSVGPTRRAAWKHGRMEAILVGGRVKDDTSGTKEVRDRGRIMTQPVLGAVQMHVRSSGLRHT